MRVTLGVMTDPMALPPPSTDPATIATAQGRSRADVAAGNGAPKPDAEATGSRAAPVTPPSRAAHAEQLLRDHGTEIYRFLRRLAASAEDAADLHQDTFVRAYLALERGTVVTNERAWLYRIAGNLARDAHRRHAVRASLAGAIDVDAAWDVAAGGAGDPHAATEAAASRDELRAALTRLSWRQRAAVVARVLDGDDYPAVAALLDCSEVTARQHVSQGLRRLRSFLSPEWEARS